MRACLPWQAGAGCSDSSTNTATVSRCRGGRRGTASGERVTRWARGLTMVGLGGHGWAVGLNAERAAACAEKRQRECSGCGVVRSPAGSRFIKCIVGSPSPHPFQLRVITAQSWPDPQRASLSTSRPHTRLAGARKVPRRRGCRQRSRTGPSLRSVPATPRGPGAQGPSLAGESRSLFANRASRPPGYHGAATWPC